jgi:hypothetical protein
MQNIDIAIVKSAFENLTKLNDKVYFEAQKEGYHQMVTKTSDGVQTSLYIFNELKNRPEIEALINEHEFTTEAKIYFGKVTSIAEYRNRVQQSTYSYQSNGRQRRELQHSSSSQRTFESDAVGNTIQLRFAQTLVNGQIILVHRLY